VAPHASNLDRTLDALGAGVHGQHKLLAAELRKLVTERSELVVVEGAERQLFKLLDRRRDQPRMAMPEVQRGLGRERIEMTVGAIAVAVDVVLDRGDQFRDGVVDAAADLLFDEDGETDLDHVHPRRAVGVKWHARADAGRGSV
jgi:hypothetical protein